MRVLPGAASADFAAFAAGVNRLQHVLGEHFAPAQGGSTYTSEAVGRLLRWAGASGMVPAAIGQSSWGPTGFAIVASAAGAQALLDGARAAGVIDPGLDLRIVCARNHGARVHDPRNDRTA
jgi:beta-ribofuranosylaminobenzene 5'-phosphate synthase